MKQNTIAEKIIEATISMNCQIFGRNSEQKHKYIINTSRHMSHTQFTKIYFALKTAIINWADSLLFSSAKRHAFCLINKYYREKVQ